MGGLRYGGGSAVMNAWFCFFCGSVKGASAADENITCGRIGRADTGRVTFSGRHVVHGALMCTPRRTGRIPRTATEADQPRSKNNNDNRYHPADKCENGSLTESHFQRTKIFSLLRGSNVRLRWPKHVPWPKYVLGHALLVVCGWCVVVRGSCVWHLTA